MARCTILDVPPELRVIICQYLEFRDLFSLIRSHRNIYEIALDALFRRDALTRNSSAIMWAASASGSSVEYANMAMMILDRSIKNGGQVDARHYKKDAVSTALHVAVAHGNKSFVEQLIYYGASINSFSLRLWEFLSVGRFNEKMNSATRLRDFAKKARIQDQCWFPLLPAMFRHGPQVANLVLNHRSNCYLAIEHKYLYVPPLRKIPKISAAYTIHHLLVEEDVFPHLHQTLFHHFRAHATFPAPVSRMSPLMKAITKGNRAATEILISLPQDLNVVSNLGWPALSYAVEGAATQFMPKARDWSKSVVKLLLEKGANANMGSPSSPLQLAVTSLVEDKIEVDPGHQKRMRQVIEVLLDYGADVNVTTADGGNLSHYMFRKMEAHSNRHSFRKLFVQFLGHGMRARKLRLDCWIMMLGLHHRNPMAFCMVGW
ncbi:Ankyrin repeat-containing domain protein [Beauveria brongniartii RCEF 3172]|uniref:Ankyrin repeat-containing domain protein n=1 Tax=Beauveria brongniartii RCEF 3172 TaxID=1081107 RepID=A0A167FIW7_9HYPO|nr:Ankyrin repeat-containing domain protein [Beauveria brongniartii RCEF 3172]